MCRWHAVLHGRPPYACVREADLLRCAALGSDPRDYACGEGCINRLTQVECLPEECRCGKHCLNQRCVPVFPARASDGRPAPRASAAGSSGPPALHPPELGPGSGERSMSDCRASVVVQRLRGR